MNMKPSRNSGRETDNCKDSVERDNATQKSIQKERIKICDALYESAGNTSKQEKRFTGEQAVYKDKQCLFVQTEGNYQRYRNLEISVGTELLQTNELVKANVAVYNKLNKDLNAQLKNIAKSIKDVKAKFADLKDAACKLDGCTKDSCNSAQWKAITGKAQTQNYKCKDDKEPDDCNGKPIDACKDAETILTELICTPNGLSLDIDSIFKSSSDVVGIQLFSNIESLDPLQKKLEEQAKAFEKHVSETMKLRSGDLGKLQDELVKSVKEITKAAMDRNNERSNFEGYKDAADFLCCPSCDCIKTYHEDEEECGDDKKKLCDQLSKPVLADCENEICCICDDVKDAFCCLPVSQPSPCDPPC